MLPVVRALARRGHRQRRHHKAEVAAAALDAGAEIVNDVSGGMLDPELLARRARAAARLRDPRPPARHAGRHAARTRVMTTWCARCATSSASGSARAARGGRARRASWSIPGSASARRAEHNLDAAGARSASCAALGCPVVVGASRKSFLGTLTGRDVGERELATAAADTRGDPARRARGARPRRRRAARRDRASPTRSRARGAVRRERARCSLFHGLTVRECAHRRRRHPHRLLPHLPRAAAHQGHARGADADRHRARRRRLLRRQAARADDAVVAARQPHQLLDHLLHRRLPARHPARAHARRAEPVRLRRGTTSRPTCSTRSSAAERLAHARVGALIVLERDADLVEFVERARRRDRRRGVRGAARLALPARHGEQAPRRRGHHQEPAHRAGGRGAAAVGQRASSTRRSARATAPPSASPRRPTRSWSWSREERGVDLAVLRRQHRARPRRARRCARRCSACSRSRSGARSARRPQERAGAGGGGRRCRSRSRSRREDADAAPMRRPTAESETRRRRGDADARADAAARARAKPSRRSRRNGASAVACASSSTSCRSRSLSMVLAVTLFVLVRSDKDATTGRLRQGHLHAARGSRARLRAGRRGASVGVRGPWTRAAAPRRARLEPIRIDLTRRARRRDAALRRGHDQGAGRAARGVDRRRRRCTSSSSRASSARCRCSRSSRGSRPRASACAKVTAEPATRARRRRQERGRGARARADAPACASPTRAGRCSGDVRARGRRRRTRASSTTPTVTVRADVQAGDGRARVRRAADQGRRADRASTARVEPPTARLVLRGPSTLVRRRQRRDGDASRSTRRSIDTRPPAHVHAHA